MQHFVFISFVIRLVFDYGSWEQNGMEFVCLYFCQFKRVFPHQSNCQKNIADTWTKKECKMKANSERKIPAQIEIQRIPKTI